MKLLITHFSPASS